MPAIFINKKTQIAPLLRIHVRHANERKCFLGFLSLRHYVDR